ncbi:hypothetical protein MMC20_005179 [Loxospora ochrophaea]|nr:hypothetical protein [Loxospora ochrophaea]
MASQKPAAQYVCPILEAESCSFGQGRHVSPLRKVEGSFGQGVMYFRLEYELSWTRFANRVVSDWRENPSSNKPLFLSSTNVFQMLSSSDWFEHKVQDVQCVYAFRAVLHGYEPVSPNISDKAFVVPSPGSKVSGSIIFGLSIEARQRLSTLLQAYKDERPNRVEVTTDDGKKGFFEIDLLVKGSATVDYDGIELLGSNFGRLVL